MQHLFTVCSADFGHGVERSVTSAPAMHGFHMDDPWHSVEHVTGGPGFWYLLLDVCLFVA